MSGKPNWRKGTKSSEVKPEPLKPIPQSTEIVVQEKKEVKPSNSSFTNPRDSTSLVFFDVIQEFVSASSEVWPNDAYIAEYNKSLVSLSGKKVDVGLKTGKKFHALFSSAYPKILAKDPSVFSQSFGESIDSLNLEKKYASSTEEVRETVWEYLRSLVQYAGMIDMYSKCPQGMLDSISNVAGGLIGKLQKGEIDASNINPLQLGQMMMKDLSQEELESFGEAIMQGGNMESMMSIVQSSMGGGMPMMPGGAGFPGMSGMSGMPDLSMLSSLFNQK